MKRFIYIVVLFFSLIGCDKNSDFDLSDHTENKLVVEGYFTDQLEYQYFTATWTNNLGDEITEYVDDLSLEILGTGSDITFNYIENGVYESDIPFAGIPGALYEIKFIHDGIEHLISTKMPSPIDIVGSYTTNFNEWAEETYYPNLHITASCNENQYLGHEVFVLVQDSLPDSSWQKIDHPVYWVYEIHDSFSQNIELTRPTLYNSDYWFDDGDVLKIKIFALSKDVGEYLIQLKEFMTSESVGSQYLNPPFYYSNEAYGLGYGTSFDSTYIYF